MRRNIFFLARLLVVLSVFPLTQYLHAQDGKSVSKSSTNFSLWNTIDYASHEKGYLYVRDISVAMQSHLAYLPQGRREWVEKLRMSSLLIHFLQAPENKFAPVYKQQLSEKLADFSYLTGWSICDKNKNVLFSKGDVGEKIFSDQIQVDENGFATPVYSANELVGYLQGRWDIFLFPEVSSLMLAGSGVQNLWLDAQHVILPPSMVLPELKEKLSSYITNQTYNGALRGRQNGLRFYSFAYKDHTVLFIFPAASWLFYLYRFSLYIFLILLVYIVYSFINGYKSTRRDAAAVLKEKDWSDNQLHEAVTLNQDSMKLTQEGYQLFLQQKKSQNENWQNLRQDIHKINEKFDRSQDSWKELFKSFFNGGEISKRTNMQKPLLLTETIADLDKKNEHADESIDNEKNSFAQEDLPTRENTSKLVPLNGETKESSAQTFFLPASLAAAQSLVKIDTQEETSVSPREKEETIAG